MLFTFSQTYVLFETFPGRPLAPQKFDLQVVSSSIIQATWEPSYSGGLGQTFEIWYRGVSETDYDWQTIVVGNDSLTTDNALMSHELHPQLWGDSHFFSLRAKTSKGWSAFVPVLKSRVLNNKTLFVSNITTLSSK